MGADGPRRHEYRGKGEAWWEKEQEDELRGEVTFGMPGTPRRTSPPSTNSIA
jgi:hypothetical protein